MSGTLGALGFGVAFVFNPLNLQSEPRERMNIRTHTELVNFIWGICNLLRGPYRRNEYRKVILPLTVLHVGR